MLPYKIINFPQGLKRGEGISDFFFFIFFYWHQVSEAFALTNSGGASALGKEFSTSAPRVIQGQLNSPSLMAPKD